MNIDFSFILISILEIILNIWVLNELTLRIALTTLTIYTILLIDLICYLINGKIIYLILYIPLIRITLLVILTVLNNILILISHGSILDVLGNILFWIHLIIIWRILIKIIFIIKQR